MFTGIPSLVMSAGVIAQVVLLSDLNYAVFFALIITHVASSSPGLTDTHGRSFYWPDSSGIIECGNTAT